MSLSLMIGGGILAGCESGTTVVPPGVTPVHVIITGDDIRLEPATTRAGDVYLVIDTPRTEASFVCHSVTDGREFTPLSDQEIARLVRGDTYQLSRIGGL